MAENTTPLRNVKTESTEDVVNRVKSQVDEIIDALDFPELNRRVQSFGRENPVALAFAALTVGVAAGMLMRKRTDESSDESM